MAGFCSLQWVSWIFRLRAPTIRIVLGNSTVVNLFFYGFEFLIFLFSFVVFFWCIKNCVILDVSGWDLCFGLWVFVFGLTDLFLSLFSFVGIYFWIGLVFWVPCSFLYLSASFVLLVLVLFVSQFVGMVFYMGLFSFLFGYDVFFSFGQWIDGFFLQLCSFFMGLMGIYLLCVWLITVNVLIVMFNFWFWYRLYFTRVLLGSPPKEFYVQIDTGSDVLWVSCGSCNGCPQSSGLHVNQFSSSRLPSLWFQFFESAEKWIQFTPKKEYLEFH